MINPENLDITRWPQKHSAMIAAGKNGGVMVQHKPTGIMVTRDEYRSQSKNRDAAIKEVERIVGKLEEREQNENK